jgi:hypothetical protein
MVTPEKISISVKRHPYQSENCKQAWGQDWPTGNIPIHAGSAIFARLNHWKRLWMKCMAPYRLSAKLWQSIRTSNTIESTSGTIWHRTKPCQGYLFRDAILDMMFNLAMCAEKQGRRVTIKPDFTFNSGGNI